MRLERHGSAQLSQGEHIASNDAKKISVGALEKTAIKKAPGLPSRCLNCEKLFASGESLV